MAKNRIMIYGQKPDGTYVALPGAHALWAVCAGRSVCRVA
jgi:hypothetical protein